MFDLEIVRVRSIPMALQRHPHGSIVHLNLHLRFRLSFSLTPTMLTTARKKNPLFCHGRRTRKARNLPPPHVAADA
jgi:hypothetical protein